MSTFERTRYLETHPESYTLVTRSPGDGGPEDDASPERLLELGGEALQRIFDSDAFVDVDRDAFFLYRLTRGDHVQLGIVGVVETIDYLEGRVKRHERVSTERVLHLSDHFELHGVHSSPIALGYRSDPSIREILDGILADTSPMLDFVSGDGLEQAVWIVDDVATCESITAKFKDHDFYIMDGHHRAAAAGEVAKRLGSPRGRYMLCVAFSDDRVHIEPFHRKVTIADDIDVAASDQQLIEYLGLYPRPSLEHDLPSEPGQIGVYLGGRWWCGTLHEPLTDSPLDAIDPVRLQQQVLGPILGIDPERSKGRISYFLDYADRHRMAACLGEREILFLLQSVTPAEVFAVADAGLDMPPKSTYVTPKPRSGVFLRTF
jgi:uncharacterized protein (DUF1015 family)